MVFQEVCYEIYFSSSFSSLPLKLFLINPQTGNKALDVQSANYDDGTNIIKALRRHTNIL